MFSVLTDNWDLFGQGFWTTIKLFLIGLPALFAATWLGLKLFGRLDEATFRKIVLGLLLASGVLLIV